VIVSLIMGERRGAALRTLLGAALLGGGLLWGCDASDSPLLVDATPAGGDAAASVEVSPQEASVTEIGGQVQFSAVAFDSAGIRLPDLVITWSSDNAAVATISPEGVATAYGSGQSIITAEAGGAAGTALLRVSPAAPFEIH
jgi:hypothetical protein